MASPRPYPPNEKAFLSNGQAPPLSANPAPGATPLLPNQGKQGHSGPIRVLCVADIRGNLKSLNELAKSANANYIIHTGDFGFYDDSSLERIAEKTFKHVAQYSPLISDKMKHDIQRIPPGQANLKSRFTSEQLPLSELPLFISGKYSLDVPVYTVWGACEDVRVLEKFRSGEYKINNLHIIDEANSRLLDIGGIKLRLLGLGGAVVMHKLFDNGEGRTTIAGGQGTMWTTLLQMGELVDTANRVYDPTETRVFVTHASPAREGLLNQLSVTLKADFSISAGLHFRYGSSYNEFSVNPTLDHYRGKLAASKASFTDVWETVKGEVEPAVAQNEAQKTLLNNALEIVQKMPTVANGGNPFGGATPGQAGAGQVDESAFKNMWNFNLADAAFGYLVLEIDGGRIGTEMRAQGFNFSHRGTAGKAAPQQAVPAPQQAPHQIPAVGQQARAPQNLPQSQPPRPQPAQSPAAQISQQTKQAPKPQSPAPAVSAGKPATPQPSGPASVNIPQAEKSPAPRANGTPTPRHPDAQSPAANADNVSLFASGFETEDEVRNALPEEHQKNIVKISKMGSGPIKNFNLHFNSHATAQAALDAAPKNSQGINRNKQYFQWFISNRSSSGYNREGQAAGGTWGPSSRGAGQPGQRQGYQSGASDSEGGRGRGGYRGRGGRGNDRGSRGGRGARGGYNKTGSGEENSTPTKPVTDAAT